MTGFVFLWSIVRRTLHDLYCQYSSSQTILKLSLSARGHLVTLIESGVHLIACNLDLSGYLNNVIHFSHLLLS